MNTKMRQTVVCFKCFLDKSPGSDPPSLYPHSVRRILKPLSNEQHPKLGHSTCERCHFHPSLSAEKKCKKTTKGLLVYSIKDCNECDKHKPTLQLVSLRRDLPSCRTALETHRSCCATADSWWLLPCHSDTLWRRPGFAGSADILLCSATGQHSDHCIAK